jgi:3-oxoacyl-[acyl-carrier protein] reductase
MMSNQLRVLVTGVASGIGKAIAERFLQDGAQLAGVDNQANGDWIVADLATSSGRNSAFTNSRKRLGEIDVLVNVAGIFRTTAFGSSQPDDWRSLWSVNLEAPIELMSLCFESMREQGFGRVVNITSVHASYSRKDCLAYDVAKAGLEAATRSFALAGADYGILANAVAPGFVRTPMSLNEHGVDEADTQPFRQQYIDSGRLPLGRAAQASEVAEAVAFLASRRNTYITGQVLTVDGGLTSTF